MPSTKGQKNTNTKKNTNNLDSFSGLWGRAKPNGGSAVCVPFPRFPSGGRFGPRYEYFSLSPVYLSRAQPLKTGC